MSGILIKMAIIGVAGIGAQWAAWRLRIPAITWWTKPNSLIVDQIENA